MQFAQTQATNQGFIADAVHELLAARGMENLHKVIVESVSDMVGKPCVFFELDSSGNIVQKASMPLGLIFYPSEYPMVKSSFISCTPSGRFFEGSPAAFTNLPLLSGRKVMGVLSILFDATEPISDKLAIKLDIFVKQAAAAIERQLFANEQSEILLDSQTERTRSALLRAISHDIRSPLTGIMGACSVLMDSTTTLPDEVEQKMLASIFDEAQWLLNMVENLLSVTRVEGNTPKIVKKHELAEEVIGEAAARCKRRFPDILLSVSAPEEPLVVSIDATLIIQVLLNLIENAVKYGDNSKPIEISVRRSGTNAIFSVQDYGPGLSADKLRNPFAVGKSVDNDKSRGLGLGLSICKGIIDIHGGSISAKNLGNGALVTFTLPLREGMIYETDSITG